MSGNHKRKRRDMNIEWMSKALLGLTEILWKLDIKESYSKGPNYKFDYCARMYELKRIGKLNGYKKS